MSALVDLSALPAPNVVEPLDFETVYAQRKAAFLALYTDERERADVAAALALESEPLARLMQENAYREIVWRQRVNDAARGVMLAYAVDEDLDQIAANSNVERLTITPADDSTTPPTPAVMEENSDLRLRAQQSFEGMSVAGPRGAYVFHARSADGRVADATAISPDPAEVVVTILPNTDDGEMPDGLIDIVTDALSDEDTRPVADRLTVRAATIVNYSISAVLYLYPGPEAEPVLAAALDRVNAYRTAQRRLGRDINRSAITAALHVEGVQKVDLLEPAVDLVLDETQAGFCIDDPVIENGGTRE